MSPTADSHVLLAEPDRETREAVSMALESLGAQVHPAEDGRTALTIARTYPLRASIIDLALPDLPGLKLFLHLRSISATPVLFIGATESKEARLQVADAGAWSFLPRPLNADVVRWTLHLFATRFWLG